MNLEIKNLRTVLKGERCEYTSAGTMWPHTTTLKVEKFLNKLLGGIIEIDKEKEQRLKELELKGKSPYKENFKPNISIKELKERFEEKQKVSIAGRIVAKREHGKVIFFDLKSGGIKLQVCGRFGLTENFEELKKDIEVGDFVGIEGETFLTRAGEKSVLIQRFKLLAKNLIAIPKEYFAPKDIETRYRKRYVDLMVNDNVFELFCKRAKIIKLIRNYLDSLGFIEVETPILHLIPGGASARPFVTYHRALDAEFFLRIAPEIYLKKLLVGGFEKIYEIGRNFRNEGLSSRHNPEFTMLEVYQAYADYNQMMELCEGLIRNLAEELYNEFKVDYQGKEIDFNNFEKVSLPEIFKKEVGVDIEEKEASGRLIEFAKEKGFYKEGLSFNELLDDFLEKYASEKFSCPTFVLDYPVDLCPLAKKKEGSNFCERFELFIAGMEVANAYSELNDPYEQLERFKKQGGAHLQGQGGAYYPQNQKSTHLQEGGKIDFDFITALAYGMPPAGGLGIGIDRLVMILTNSASIKEIILFPTLKPI